MCQSLDEGGRRCPSSETSHRRGKDRAAYRAKRLGTAGIPVLSIAEMESSRVGLKSNIDATISLRDNSDFKVLIEQSRNKMKEYESSPNPELLTEVELECRTIGSSIDARARELAKVTAASIVEVQGSIESRTMAARRKFKREFSKVAGLSRRSEDNIESQESNDESLSSNSAGNENDLIELVKVEEQVVAALKKLRSNLALVESSDNHLTMDFLTNLREGYRGALAEVRAMGCNNEINGEPHNGDGVKGLDAYLDYLPTNWLKLLVSPDEQSSNLRESLRVTLVALDQLNAGTSLMSFHRLIGLLGGRVPLLDELMGEFLVRRSKGKSLDPKMWQRYRLSEDYVVEGYFVDMAIGQIPARNSSSKPALGGAEKTGKSGYRILSAGLDAIYVLRSSLGGLIGVTDHQVPVQSHDDDMRQFVLGLLALC